MLALLPKRVQNRRLMVPEVDPVTVTPGDGMAPVRVIEPPADAVVMFSTVPPRVSPLASA
jgi:hypothetical protein